MNNQSATSAHAAIQSRIAEFLRSTPSHRAQRYEVGGSPFFAGLDLSELTHSEIFQVLVSLTRTLDKAITDDIYRLWAWCGASFWSLHHQSPLAHANHYWLSEFFALLHLLLARVRDPGSIYVKADPFREVNRHAIVVASPGVAQTIASPLAFALIEGALRRLSGGVLELDGRIAREVPAELTGKLKKGRQWVNQIDEAFAIYEWVVQDNPTTASHLSALMDAMKEVLARLQPSNDDPPVQQIGSWRNATMHGQQFWEQRVPLLMNLICFLVIHSIGETHYDSNRTRIVGDAGGSSAMGRAESAVRWNVFPPDLLMSL